MQIVATPPTVPANVDASLVPGLLLPRIPGLPDVNTPGKRIDEILAPPDPGSLVGKADLAAVRAAQKLRTTNGNAWAQHLAKEGSWNIWMQLAARHRSSTGVVQGWLGTALLAATMAANAAATQAVKWHYRRQRPFQLDPSITTVVPRPRDPSYPSGHTSSAFAAARVIARLAPTLAAEAYSIATQVAVSRVYAGVHFPTDVVAGALLGTGVAEAVLRRR